MQQEFFASLGSLPAFALYLAVSLTLMGVFVAIYVGITPYKEFELIRNGNTAAGLSLSGVMVGFAVALSSVVEHSVSLVDLTIWGVVALVVQAAAYAASRHLIKGLDDGIREGKIAHGIFLGVVSLCCGILNGACMTP